jgi:two-component system, NtrC family, nitrogen regulation sensor histidine kinase GlnL
MSQDDGCVICRKIVDNLTSAVMVFDPEYRLLFINTTGEMLFADSARHLVGLRAQELLTASNQSIESQLKQCLATGVPRTERNVVLGLPERQVTADMSLTPLFEGVRPTSVLIELHQLDRHLRISRDEQLLAQHNASRILFRGLAHEIKNPLGGLRGAAQLLDRELNSGELREYTQIMIAESDRLQSLLDRMLGPSKPPEKSLLNIHRVVERVRQLVQVEAPMGVSIECDYDPSLPMLYADKDQLIQAILNIARNAIQAVGERGNVLFRTRIHRQVTIGRQHNRLAVKIDVIDDGPGIEPDMMSQIFYPMVTGRADGTGLGLSIAQSLINQHDGLIEVTSEPGHTVFSIFLPLRGGNE